MDVLQHLSYHHDVVLQLATAYGQLQVGHGPEAVLQRSAAIIYHVFHREVISCGPALIMLIPGRCNITEQSEIQAL